MLSTAIIVFREVLEAALIMGIVSAATRSVPGRNRWLWGGLALGLIGACAVAGFTDVISNMASGLGQELFNALVLGVAVVMLAWHNIWMSSHGAQLAADARNVGRDVQDGRKERTVIMVAVALAVLREGSETVLFLYGIAAGGAGAGLSMLLGGVLGTLAGAAVGYALYAGLLRIPARWFFSATSTLVLILAAGLASQAAHFLIQADLLPSLAAPLWDSSAWIPQDSAAGVLLHSLAGYDARPAGMQVVFFGATLIVIALGMAWTRRPNFQPLKQQGAVC